MPIIRSTPEQMMPLAFFPSVAKKVGVDAAVLLQIIVQQTGYAEAFISDPMQKGDFYKVQDSRIWVQFPYSEFEKKMPWVSGSTIKRIIKNLTQKGALLLERQTDSLGGNQANWYSVDSFDKPKLKLIDPLPQKELNSMKP